MDGGKLNHHEIAYMILQNKGKFWEVQNQGSLNHFRFGKLKNGVEVKVESHHSNYETEQHALDRANFLIDDKRLKGYQMIGENEGLKQTSILDRFTTPVHQRKKEFDDELSPPKELSKIPLQEINLQKVDRKLPIKNRFTNLLPNLLPNSTRFQGAFLERETDAGFHYFKIQINGKMMRCDSWREGVSPKKSLKELENPEQAEERAKKYIQELSGRGFYENPQNFKYDFFYTPLSKDDDLEVDVLDNGKEITPIKLMPFVLKENKRLLVRYESIEDMLKSIGLERFCSVFETENLSFREFLRSNERDLEKLGLPPSARRKIAASIINGKWRPAEDCPEKRQKSTLVSEFSWN